MEISPESEIVFHKSTSNSNPKQTLLIHNTHHDSGTIAFKVKTTAPKQFVVKPNAGKLGPGEKTEVTIVLLLGNGADTKRKDKFLIQSIKLTPAVAELEDKLFQAKVTELWAQAEQVKKSDVPGPDIVTEKKVRCVYALDEPVTISPSETGKLRGLSPASDLDRKSVSKFEEALAVTPVKGAPVVLALNSTDSTASPKSNATLDKVLKDLHDATTKIASLSAACDGYKMELERVNTLRQRKADTSLPPTSTVNPGATTRTLHKPAAHGVNFQALVILCFISFFLGAWLF